MKSEAKNILITCAGGSGPLYLAKTLRKRHAIFLADGSKDNVAALLDFPFAVIPFGSSPRYKTEIKKLLKKWRIDCIVPGADEELLPIKELCEENPSLVAVIPSKTFIELSLDKKALMQKLKEEKISFLAAFDSIEEVHYPAIAKPNRGRGSREVHLLKDRRELEGYLALYKKNFKDLVVQPYIPGTEYTVSVVVNNLNRLIGIVPKKIILKRGITRVAVSENNREIQKVCRKILKILSPQGPFNVQLKLWKGKVYIFEINPRLSTTLVLTDKVFGNEVELYLSSYNQNRPRKPRAMKGGVYLYRYEENVFN